MLSVLAPAFALAGTMLGCGFGSYKVVRLRDGRALSTRFVSTAAYEASAQATIAEEEGDFSRAVVFLRKARDEDPDAPDLQARLGRALCRLGKKEAADFAFADALRTDPDNERAFTARAECSIRSGPTNHAAARKDLAQALRLDSESIEPALMWIELDLADGLLPAARTRAEEAARLHPASGALLRVLACVAAQQGDLVAANVAARKAGAFDTREGKRAADEIAMVRQKLGIGLFVPDSTSFSPETVCDPELERQLAKVIIGGDVAEIVTAMDALQSSCPEREPPTASLRARWSETKAGEIEAEALASSHEDARRFAQRARLRTLRLEDMAPVLPVIEDRESLALTLAHVAYTASEGSRRRWLVTTARRLGPAEPTVARLLARVARTNGASSEDADVRRARELAVTTQELADAKP